MNAIVRRCRVDAAVVVAKGEVGARAAGWRSFSHRESHATARCRPTRQNAAAGKQVLQAKRQAAGE